MIWLLTIDQIWVSSLLINIWASCGPMHLKYSWKFLFSGHFFKLIFPILKGNVVWLFTIMSYRWSFSFIVIDQYLIELWVLGLRIFKKISVFWTFFILIFQILKWKVVWLFTIMSYRWSLSFVIIEQYFSELWALGLNKVCCGGILVPFRGRHLVVFFFRLIAPSPNKTNLFLII
jgi:hypothetical protein